MLKDVPLSLIRTDGQTQPRTDGVNLFVVANYGELMQAGTRFPPGSATFDGEHYWLYGGFHRYHAHKAQGAETMALEVVNGTVEDARWLCLGENKDHGLNRTNKDKHHAVDEALKMRPELSNRQIAEHCGVSPGLVDAARNRLPNLGSQPPTRISRDGRRRPSDQKRTTRKREGDDEGNEDDDEQELPLTATPEPAAGFPHSERIERWLDMVVGELATIQVEEGGIGARMSERDKWNWNQVRGYILPMLDDLAAGINKLRKEIEAYAH